jgi:hypothetical protein
MRAQNEPPRRLSGIVRGQSRTGRTDIPSAYEVDRVDEQASQRAGSGRRAAARSSPASSSARRRGSEFSTSALRPVERRRCSPATSRRSRVNEARARELEGERRRLGATTCMSFMPTGSRGRRRLTGFDRATRRRAVLGSRGPRGTARSALALGAAPRASARPPPCGGRAHETRRHDRLLRLHDQR